MLVILAILAAILVPALLGWIDKAREKQYVLDARSVYMATQTIMDERYAANPTDANMKADLTEDEKDEISKIADVTFSNITGITFEERKNAAEKINRKINAMTITSLDSKVDAELSANGWKITPNGSKTTTPSPSAGSGDGSGA